MGKSLIHKITATQLVRDFAEAAKEAALGDLAITKHGKVEYRLINEYRYTALTCGEAADSAIDYSRLKDELKTVLDSVRTLVIILDDEQRILRANRAMCERLAKQEEDLIGLHVLELELSPQLHHVSTRIKNVTRSGEKDTFDVHPSAPDERFFKCMIKRLPSGVAVFMDDKTDRRELDRRTFEYAARKKSIAALGTIAVANVRDDGEIISMTGGLPELIESTNGALLGSKIQAMLDPESREKFEAALHGDIGVPCGPFPISYLKGGMTLTNAMMVVTPYRSVDHLSCAAVAIMDN